MKITVKKLISLAFASGVASAICGDTLKASAEPQTFTTPNGEAIITVTDESQDRLVVRIQGTAGYDQEHLRALRVMFIRYAVDSTVPDQPTCTAIDNRTGLTLPLTYEYKLFNSGRFAGTRRCIWMHCNSVGEPLDVTVTLPQVNSTSATSLLRCINCLVKLYFRLSFPPAFLNLIFLTLLELYLRDFHLFLAHMDNL